MQTTINIFTIFGSVLGIIAFFIMIFSSLHIYNLKKWEELSKVINFTELDEYCEGASSGIIYSDVSSKFYHLVYLIRNNSELIQFKGIVNNKIERNFSKILKLAKKLSDEIQVPKWDVCSKNDSIVYKLNKDYIYDNAKSQIDGDKYAQETLKNVTEIIEQIITLYREIYSLSNRLPHEYIFKLK